jgi:succinate dehydrogenase/fumarate reductase cytochrome b subunit
MFFDYNGIIGLIILILDIWAIINIVKSSAPDTNKILWVVIVILLPLIGLILWFLMGPGKKRGTSV